MAGQESFLYSHPLLYHWTMRLLYGRHFQARYAELATQIPDGCSVVEICAGDCYFFRKHLHRKGLDYLALDSSARFVEWAKQRGIPARLFDLWEEEAPPADVVVMQASLYQFIPHADRIITKLRRAAREKVMIAEPIRNLSDSGNPLLAGISRFLTRPDREGERYAAKRFNRESFQEILQATGGVRRTFLLPGGREMVAELEPLR